MIIALIDFFCMKYEYLEFMAYLSQLSKQIRSTKYIYKDSTKPNIFLYQPIKGTDFIQKKSICYFSFNIYLPIQQQKTID